MSLKTHTYKSISQISNSNHDVRPNNFDVLLVELELRS